MRDFIIRIALFTFFTSLQLIFPGVVSAQLIIDDQKPIEEIVSDLAGPGVKVELVRIDCPETGYGFFDDNSFSLGLSEGLILTTGAAGNAVGPNNAPDVGNEISGRAATNSSLKFLEFGDGDLFDECALQLRITVYSDTLSFRYVFGSEEYPEYVEDYHDVFGFFIEGPGIVPDINGLRNLAVLPVGDRTTPISVSNVNEDNNGQFFVNNGVGSTPFINLFVQYDGYTVPLEATVQVTPCSTYTLNLSIADNRDGILDSGVFIESRSFTSNVPNISIIYDHPELGDYLVEECNGATIRINSPNPSTSHTFNLNYGGTATSREDYISLPEFVFIPGGEDFVEIPVIALADSIDDNNETLTIEVENICPDLPPLATFEVPIKEGFEYYVETDLNPSICPGDTIALNPNFVPELDYSWTPADFLSCTDCPNPLSWAPSDITYKTFVVHSPSNCRLENDSLTVELEVLEQPEASFRVTQPTGTFNAADVQFTNTSSNSNVFFWDFGDGTTSTQESPFHTFPLSAEFGDTATYQVILQASNEDPFCDDFDTIDVTVGPIQIPNVFTPNGDAINDMWKTLGFVGDWDLIVVNRWGRVIHEYSGEPIWDPEENVPGGSYFYLLRNPEDGRQFKGFIHLMR